MCTICVVSVVSVFTVDLWFRDMFKFLASSIEPLLRSHWTVHSRRMAKVGNGSVVDAEAILGATLRWLAGGSVWDAAFMFKVAPATFHDYKWRVIDALNFVLKDNVLFPTSDEGACVSARPPSVRVTSLRRPGLPCTRIC